MTMQPAVASRCEIQARCTGDPLCPVYGECRATEHLRQRASTGPTPAQPAFAPALGVPLPRLCWFCLRHAGQRVLSTTSVHGTEACESCARKGVQ